MCLLHIRLQLFPLTPIFFYYITHVHLLQFSPPSIPDISCPPPQASRGSAIHIFLVNLHLLRPWNTCKVWISYADVSSPVWHEIYDHPNNLQIESDAFCASGLVVMGFLLWEEGSGKQDLRVVEGWGLLCQVLERAACVNSGVTL